MIIKSIDRAQKSGLLVCENSSVDGELIAKDQFCIGKSFINILALSVQWVCRRSVFKPLFRSGESKSAFLWFWYTFVEFHVSSAGFTFPLFIGIGIQILSLNSNQCHVYVYFFSNLAFLL
jgi:hypothetical protein